MTKRHFIMLAEAIRTHNSQPSSKVYPHFSPAQIDAIADVCAASNPQFNRERWLGYINDANGPSGGKKPAKSYRVQLASDTRETPSQGA